MVGAPGRRVMLPPDSPLPPGVPVVAIDPPLAGLLVESEPTKMAVGHHEWNRLVMKMLVVLLVWLGQGYFRLRLPL